MAGSIVSVSTSQYRAEALRRTKQPKSANGCFATFPSDHPYRFQRFVVGGAIPRTSAPYALQNELFVLCEQNDAILICVPREHGKTWFEAYYIEYKMEIDKENILLLSWSHIRKHTALRVYNYFLQKDMIKKDAGLRPSPLHFTTIDGVKFDSYRVTSGQVLGFHDYTIIVDDAIDMSFKDRPDKSKQLELVWGSTMENINPKKLIIVGTRKFRGDFYEFIMDMYKDRLKIVVWSPWHEDGTLRCPEKWTEERLQQKKEVLPPYMWHAEYMQDPKPMEGGDWDNVDYDAMLHYKFYDHVCISIDRATTKNKTSDYTGFVVVLKKLDKLEYLVIKDHTARIGFEALKDKIEQEYKELRDQFVDTNVIVVLEKQGGGDDMYDSAHSQSYAWTKNCVLVHSNRPKEDKIRDALGTAEIVDSKKILKNIKFIHGLDKSSVVDQVRTFPGCLAYNDDAIDALSMGINELEKRNTNNTNWVFQV